jgi:hypothetical protein
MNHGPFHQFLQFEFKFGIETELKMQSTVTLDALFGLMQFMTGIIVIGSIWKVLFVRDHEALRKLPRYRSVHEVIQALNGIGYCIPAMTACVFLIALYLVYTGGQMIVSSVQ